MLPYEITHVQSVPTLSLLDSITFDNVTEDWLFTYETMALDSPVQGQINRYHRVLYFTASGHDVGMSDSGNLCLQPGTDFSACMAHLNDDYVVLVGAANASDPLPRDSIESTT